MAVSCSDRNSFTVSTSEVQRWMMSPVRFFMCQPNGSLSMCAKSRLAHRFDKRFGGFCVVQSLDITEHRGQKRENGYRRRDYPEPLSQHRHPSDKVDDAVCKSGRADFSFPITVSTVKRLSAVHKTYCRKHKRGDHTHGKKTLASVKKHKEQTSRRNCPSAGILFFLFFCHCHRTPEKSNWRRLPRPFLLPPTVFGGTDNAAYIQL